jgi:hypothetical protein
MDLAMLRRQLVDGVNVTLTHRDPTTEALASYILFVDDAREIVERLERAERVEAAAAALGTHVDELESCLNDRGRPSAPCHGQPMHAVLDARDALDIALGGPK